MLLVWFAVVRSTEQQRSRKAFSLRTIIIGIHNYRDTIGVFPSNAVQDGDPLSSWRFQLLPFLTSLGPRRPELGQRWNAPANSHWRGIILPDFCWDENTNSSVFMVQPRTGSSRKSNRAASAEVGPAAQLILFTTSSTIHWMEPGDVDLRTALNGKQPNREFFVAFLDEEVLLLRTETPLDLLLMCADPKTASEDHRATLRTYAIWQSKRQRN